VPLPAKAGVKKESENSTSEHSDDNENNFGYENPKSSKEPENSKAEDSHAKRMSELKKCYSVEWDAASYPSRFKEPTLHTFNGKISSNQHIYYFKSQTGNVLSNDTIMARLFIGTLKRVAFEWFMKLPMSSIKKWPDLEKLFLARFFEDDTETSVLTLLATKQKKEESIKMFVETFQSMALRCPSGMTQSTLIKSYRYNYKQHS